MSTAPAARRHGETPFIFRRTVAAPPPRVWRAWTDRTELMAWFGPSGSTMSGGELDLRPGSSYRYGMRTADGHEMWGRQDFRAVEPLRRIELIQSFTDAAGHPARHPFAPTWPQEWLSVVTFAPAGAGTAVEVRWTVWNGSDEEHRTFDAAHPGMQQGWGGTFDRLDLHLAKG